jgi:hypothetical protein
MAGQPNVPGFLEFDVTDLTLSDNTVHEDDSFDVTVTYTGTGGIWNFLEFISDNFAPLNATAQFYSEGMGVGAGENDLGSVDVQLITGGSPYSASITVDTSVATTDLDEGVYRIQCLVQVENSGIMGFFEGDILLSMYD